jgi:hypothetical protein
MNHIQKRDLRFGGKSEVIIKPRLEAYFKCSLIQSKDKFAVFDFYDSKKNKFFELKTRRTYKYDYNDVMIGSNKIREGLRLLRKGCAVYIVWKFLDRLCYFELEKNNIDKSWYREGGRSDRGKRESDMLCYIPTSKMIDII